jgi:hypothetical protein
MGEVNLGAAPPAAAPIVSDVPDSFPWHVWHDRHPALIAQIRDAHPYPPGIGAGLAELVDETLAGAMQPLPPGAPDKRAWDAWGHAYYGRSWLEVPWLWAESYFYRRLLHAVDFFTPGPWFALDPFAFLKTPELRASTMENDLAVLDRLAALTPGERTRVLLHGSLWGNQADLGFRIGIAAVHGRMGPSAHLVVDRTEAVVSTLDARPETVCLVADNAGRELLADLVLVDHLLDAGLTARVVLYLKPQPYYVSDAVTADLVGCLGRLAAGPPAAAAIEARLRRAVAGGRLDVATHPFFCAPFPFHHMPPDLAEAFVAASLVILKGDLNYRRLVGDCHWPESTPFADTVGYFPAPVVALRTLKSDVVVGLKPGDAAALDAEDTGWRVSGRYALVEFQR